MEKRILHLVLYSPSLVYDAMREETSKLYRQYSDRVHTVYYYFDEKVEENTLDGDLLRLKGTETFIPGVLDKTLKAMKYFNTEEYTFVVRSNISTVVNFDLLIPRLTPNFKYGGSQVQIVHKIDKEYGIVDDSFMWTPYAHGTCIIFDNETWKWVNENTDKVNMRVMDDVSIGVLIKRYKPEIFVKRLNPPEVYNLNKNTNCDEVICYRNHAYGTNRQVDIAKIRYLVNLLITRKRIKGHYVNFVKYGTGDRYIDITDKLKLICETKTFVTDSNNVVLDAFFGDPAPGKDKNLVMQFRDGSIFDQRGIFKFSYRNGKIYVD